MARTTIAPRTIRERARHRRESAAIRLDETAPGDEGVRLAVVLPDGNQVGLLVSADDATTLGADLVIRGSFLRGVVARDTEDRTPGPDDVPLIPEVDGA